jgi:hypothetical protein
VFTIRPGLFRFRLLDSSSFANPSRSMTDNPPRRFPPPWTLYENPESFVVLDANGHALAYVYFEDERGRREVMKLISRRRRATDWKLCEETSPASIRSE